MSNQPLSFTLPSSPPAAEDCPDDFAELVGELERQWQSALSQDCSPSQLKELCCLTPLLIGDGVPGPLTELVRRIDTTLRVHIEARSVPGVEDRQAVTAALVRLRAGLGGEEVVPDGPRAPVRSSLVYIVSNDPAQGQYLALQVAAHGFETRILTEPVTLREQVMAAPPGALIVDIAAGKAVIDQVGAVKQAAAGCLPVVFIASQGDARTRLAALRAGGDGYFTRPVPVPELVAKLRELTGDRQRPLRVLMVDDDRAILELYGGQLRGAGFQVHALSDPWGVLEAAVEFQPELILLDLYMPEVDGFEISRLLRQEERFLNVPIVFLSGERDVHKQVKAFDAGAFDFLVKPVKPGQLIELVRARASQYRRLADKVQYLGKTDPVTGLYNRHYFTTLLAERLQEPDPVRGSIRALLFMELDRLPQAGTCPTESESLNLMRTKVARIITDYLIKGDVAAAYSEGVFTVLAEREDLAALEALAEALRQGVEALQVPFKGGILDPSASIGLARVQGNPRSAISNAALACSLARLAGGNTVRLQEDLRDKAQDQEQRQYWMKQIGDAVKDRRLFLVYQPIASLAAENLERFEVLLRIRDEAGQTVLPGQFMEMARQLGLTRLLDRWVVSQSLANLALQQQTKPNTTFFVKLATETLLEGGFMDWLTKSMGQHKLRVNSCVFEFPEADLRNQPAVNRSLIKRLQSLGIGLAIEHFSGTDQSLEMLESLPANYVKLDRNLVHNLPDCQERQQKVRKIIDRARNRGICTIAAYVEDAAALSLLWQYKIDLIQGFFLQQPHEVARYDIAL